MENRGSETDSAKLRDSATFTILNLGILLLSPVSILPTLLLKSYSPAPLRYAFIAVSVISYISCFLEKVCFASYIALFLASFLGQILAVVALFELKSQSDLREAKILLRVECGVRMAIFVLQLMVLATHCLDAYWVRDNSGVLEADDEA